MTNQQAEEINLLRKLVCGLYSELYKADHYIKQLGVKYNINELREAEICNKDREIDLLSKQLSAFTDEGIQDIYYQNDKLKQKLQKCINELKITNGRYQQNRKQVSDLVNEMEKMKKLYKR